MPAARMHASRGGKTVVHKRSQTEGTTVMCCNVAHAVSQVVSHLKGYKGCPSTAEAEAAALLMELTGRTLDSCPSYWPSCKVRKGFAVSFVGLDVQWSKLC